MNWMRIGLPAVTTFQAVFCTSLKLEKYGSTDSTVEMDDSYISKYKIKKDEDGCCSDCQIDFPADRMGDSVASTGLFFGLPAFAVSLYAYDALRKCLKTECTESDLTGVATTETLIAGFGVGSAFGQLIFMLLNAMSNSECSKHYCQISSLVLCKILVYSLILGISHLGDLQIELGIITGVAILESVVSAHQ